MEELQLFEGKHIRSLYDAAKQVYYFSVVDIMAILLEKEHQAARTYWKKLAQRLREEGSDETVSKCHRLKLMAADGKMRATDVADVQTLLRIIQSVPSKKAEPIKQWLAKVGTERMQEMADPVQALNRARAYWKQQGRSEKWVQQRMLGQETRTKLTDYWKTHDVKEGQEYAILTNVIHQEWSGLSVKNHKELKGLQSHNLRDHMNEAELIFTALAELSTRQIAESQEAIGFSENKQAAKTGGSIAKKARLTLEQKIGASIISKENYLKPTLPSSTDLLSPKKSND